MRIVELEPRLYKKEYTDYYGIAQMYYHDDRVDLFDCGSLIARIIEIERGKAWELQMLVLHPTQLEANIIKEFAWQNGIRGIRYNMRPTELRKRFGFYEGRI